MCGMFKALVARAAIPFRLGAGALGHIRHMAHTAVDEEQGAHSARQLDYALVKVPQGQHTGEDRQHVVDL